MLFFPPLIIKMTILSSRIEHFVSWLREPSHRLPPDRLRLYQRDTRTHMIRRARLGSIGLATLLVLSAVWSAGALVGGVAAAGNTTDGDDTRANATVVETPATVEGTVETDDDATWYRVNLDPDDLLLAEIVGTTDLSEDEIPPRKSISVYNADGDLVTSTETEPNSNQFVTPQGLENGTYYVRVTADAIDYDDAYEGTVSYNLTLKFTEGDPTELDGNASDATELADGETASANIDLFDADTFTFDAEQGDEVTVTVEQTGGINVADQPSDVGFGVYAPGDARGPVPGKVDTEVNHVDGESTVTFTANETGTYTIDVFQPLHGFLIQPNEVTQYDISVTVDSQDETNETPDDGETETDPGHSTITFDRQQTDGETVVVQSVVAQHDGFVVVTDSDGDVRGSTYFDAGTDPTEDVVVELEEPVDEDQTLTATNHEDNDEDEELDETDYPLELGETGEPVTDDGCIDVVEDESEN
jgi:hypothetical protein